MMTVNGLLESFMLVLAIVNCMALGFAWLLWHSLDRRYRAFFLAGALFPLVVGMLGGTISGRLVLASISGIELGGFLLRGWLIIAIICGAALCRILSYYHQKRDIARK